MAGQIETTEEYLACSEAMQRLAESGWSLDDEDDNHALRLMWMAGRDWAKSDAASAALGGQP